MNTCNFPNKLIYNRLFKNILIKSNLYIPTMVAQTVKNLPAMKETWVWSLGWEDPLEKGMTNHSSILVWRIPWTEELGGLQSTRWSRVGYDRMTNILTLTLFRTSREHVVVQLPSRVRLCDPTDCSKPGLPVPHHLLEFAQIHDHCISDPVQPSPPLTPSYPSAFNLSQHQGLSQWVSC